MGIHFQCGSCGATGTAKEELAGRIVNCPRCESLMEIPAGLEIVEEPAPGEDPPRDFLPPAQPPAVSAVNAEPRPFQFSVAWLLKTTVFVSGAVAFVLPFFRPGTLWAGLVGFIILTTFGLYYAEKNHRLKLTAHRKRMAERAEASKNGGSEEYQGFPLGAGILMGLGLWCMLGATVTLVGRQYKDALGQLQPWDEGQAEVIGLGLACGLFVTGACRLARWIGRDR